MNYIWAGMIIFSVVCALFNANANELSAGILNSAQHAVEISLKLLGGICFWSGLMEIAQKSGLTRVIGKLLFPLMKIIFPELREEKEILGAISMNVTANLLGLGNAATPLGIEAMRLMQGKNPDKARASDAMVNFVVMNTAAIELVPTTVALIRLNSGCLTPFDILPIVLFNSLVSLTGGLLLSKIICRVVK
ncbi:MAG: spore maturation protein A [Clostridiales bacterium]|nr:spore maturation protein A [Clostridiales bacterium]